MIGIESRIKPRLQALNASIALLAFLAGTSKAGLSEAAAGVTNLSVPVALRVDATLKLLEDFVASIAPVKPDLRDGRAVESWLEDFQARRAKTSEPADVEARVA